MFNVTEVIDEEEPWRGLPVVFDGDELSYVASVGNETRSIRVRANKPFAQWQEFKTRTEFYQSIGEKPDPDDFTIEDVQLAYNFDKCKTALDQRIQGILSIIDTNEYKGFLGEGSPREAIATIWKYKGNREGMVRPVQLKQARQYIIDTYGFEQVDGTKYEADDYISIYASKFGYIAAVNDKDQYQCGNTWLFKPGYDVPKWLDEFGTMYVDKSGASPIAKGCGDAFLAYQCLCVEQSDNFKATALCNAKFGPASAEKLIKKCSNKAELWNAVAKQYQKWYPQPVDYKHCYTGEPMQGTWHSIFNEIFQLAYMYRDFDDQKTGYNLMDELEIDYES